MVEGDEEVSSEVSLQYSAATHARARELFFICFLNGPSWTREADRCIASETEKKIKKIMITATSFKVPFVSCYNTYKVSALYSMLASTFSIVNIFHEH